MAENEAALTHLLDPISQTTPCGENCRKHEQFIRLKDEVRKLDHVNSNGTINWSIVAKHATTYLSSQSKDCLVAAYLMVAWAHNYGLNGLEEALVFLTKLIKKFGSNIHPQGKLKVQISALVWMAKHLLNYCQQLEITAQKIEPLKKIKTHAIKLNELLNKTFGSEVLGKFINHIDAVLQQFDITQAHFQAKAKQAQTTLPEQEAESVEITQEQLAAQVSNFSHEESSLIDEMLKFSESLRHQHLFDLQAYIYSRSALWQDMQYVAERLAEDDLYIPAPQHRFVKQVEGLEHSPLDNDDFASLEQIAINHPYWLDVHFQVAQKSVAISGDSAIYNLIIAWLNQMLRTFPAFSQLKFEDGSASISVQTLNALQAVNDTVISVEEDDIVSEINKLANLGAKAAKTRIEKIQQDLNGITSAKARLHANLKLLSVLPGTPISNYLPFYLKQIETDFHHFHLEEWDPELAVKVLTTLYKVNKSLGSQANNEQIQFALAKLMILDHTRFTELESYAQTG